MTAAAALLPIPVKGPARAETGVRIGGIGALRSPLSHADRLTPSYVARPRTAQTPVRGADKRCLMDARPAWPARSRHAMLAAGRDRWQCRSCGFVAVSLEALARHVVAHQVTIGRDGRPVPDAG